MRRTTVFGVYDHGQYGAVERVSDHLAVPPPHQPRQRYWKIVAKRAVLAAGASERPIAFAGNDRPGVMLAGAVRTYLNRFAATPASRLVVFTNNDDGWRTAADCAGRRRCGRGDCRFTRRCARNAFQRRLKKRGSHLCRGAGRARERDTRRSAQSRSSTQTDARVTIACDGLGVCRRLESLTSSYLPSWRQAAMARRYRRVRAEDTAAWHDRRRSRRWRHESCRLSHDRSRSRSARGVRLRLCGQRLPASPRRRTRSVAIAPLWWVKGSGKAFVDLQNDVTVKDVALAKREGFRSVEHLKRYTTLGMATDQGKIGGVSRPGDYGGADEAADPRRRNDHLSSALHACYARRARRTSPRQGFPADAAAAIASMGARTRRRHGRDRRVVARPILSPRGGRRLA